MHIKNWVDTHANLPPRARWIAKADVVPSWNNKPGNVDPPPFGGFLFPDSAISSEIIQAYLETEYFIHSDPIIGLRIGEANSQLLDAHKQHQINSSAFITAWNPEGQVLSGEGNAERHQRLLQELAHRSLKFIEGIGQHPSNDWTGETSVLVFGLTLEAAKTLGIKYQQNAIVWSGADSTPQLILLR